ncbi:HisA/HisF-related TIM barrel protein, partial [Bacillus altitudinis]|uniref:HisA/HisF-related TIM barrel protein n=1 Tax=Bacillus altitudinis TaxID=293387 RepID=UPI001F1C6315
EGYMVYREGGGRERDLEVSEWGKEGVGRGGGEMLVSRMDGDGEKRGFEDGLRKVVSEAVTVGVIG